MTSPPLGLAFAQGLGRGRIASGGFNGWGPDGAQHCLFNLLLYHHSSTACTASLTDTLDPEAMVAPVRSFRVSPRARAATPGFSTPMVPNSKAVRAKYTIQLYDRSSYSTATGYSYKKL